MPLIFEGGVGESYEFTLDDKDGIPVPLHPTPTRQLQKVTGIARITAPRTVLRSRPTAHGVIDETRWTAEGLFVLEGYVMANDMAGAIAEFRELQKPMLETLDNAPALLKWTEQGVAGLSLQASVKLAADVDFVAEPGPNIVRYQAQLRAADPRAYSQTLTAATGATLGIGSGGLTFNRTFNITFAASTGGTVAVNNLGNRPSPPIFRLYGGVTNAQILLVGTTGKIVLTGNVAAGDYLEIDVQNRSIKLNGTSNALFYLDAANTTWFELPVGTSTIRAIGFTFDATARCDVLYRSAYT